MNGESVLHEAAAALMRQAAERLAFRSTDQTLRTPVRLALASLEHEGLIEISPGGGYQMRRFTPREIGDAIRVRGVIEGFAACVLLDGWNPEP